MQEAQVHAGRVVAETLQLMKTLTINGERSVMVLNDAAEEYMLKNDVRPACNGYSPTWNNMTYRHGTCISINEEALHGVPSANKTLIEGDIVSFDMVGGHQGWYVDAALTIPVGTITAPVVRLLEATEIALYQGIAMAITGNTVADISRAIETIAKEYQLSAVHGYTGHGIGQKIHLPPEIPNIDVGSTIVLQEGMTVCIEPVFTLGNGESFVSSDGWTVLTCDRKPVAHFEHTVCVGDTPTILTKI